MNCNSPLTTDEKPCPLDILKHYWGYDSFRGIQQNIIDSILQRKDTLGLMPTGGGKSITFQVPAMVMPGVCIVITPLVALMKDQVEHLRKLNIRASALYSSMSRTQIIKTLENAIFGGIKLLYVSPERLESTLFINKLKHINVSFITVDEAHCISQWGYDFRPSYLKIAEIRKLKPNVPVLALTATATPMVVDDIQQRLNFAHENVFRMSFERKNLAYVVRYTDDKASELIHILKSTTGSAIVYVHSRKRAKELSQLLEDHRIDATFYHAGLDPSTKDLRQSAWKTDQKRVIVATNAFGMGIDKPDVRLVIHYDSPDSIEAYFQEAGRAGRDGQKAYAVLLWNNGEAAKLKKRINETYPEKDYIAKVYTCLAYFYEVATGSGAGKTYALNVDKFCFIYKFFPVPATAALRLLTSAGYIHFEEDPDAKARLMFILKREELYRLKENTREEEQVITSVLRNYGGVFADYVYVDESLIAHEAELSKDQTYQILKSLSQRRILSFIPQRKTPLLTFIHDRVDEEEVILPPNVYDERKDQYTKRVMAIIEYADNAHICRSKQLLRYFGELTSHECGTCDVCLEQKQTTTANKDVQQAIINLLSDKKHHSIREIKELPYPTPTIVDAIKQLSNEEIIATDNASIFLA